VSGATPATATTGFAIRSDSGAAVITASNTSVGSPHPTTNEFAVAFTMHMNLSIGAKGWVRKRRDIINLMWQVRTLAGTQIVFERRQVTGVVETLTTPTAFLPDVPHFVVATWTPGEMALYVDGNLMASSTTITATDTATTLPLQLFQTSIGGANGGTLDDFIVLDRALSAAEVTSLYAEWASGPGVPINVLRDFSATASANDAIASQNNPTATTASDRIFDGTNPANDAIASQNTPTLSTNGGLTTTNAERALGTETLVQSNVTRAFSATSAANNAVASQNTPSLNGSGQRTFSMTAGGEAISSQNTPTLARSVTPAATGAGNNATASQNTPTLLRNRGFETAAQADQNKAIGSEFAQLAAPAEFAATGAGNNAVASQGPQVTDTFASTLALNFPPTFWWQLDSITGSNDSGTAGTGAGSPIGASLGAGGLISQQQTSALFDATGDRVESNNTTSWQTTSPTHSYTLGAWFEIDSFSGAGDQFVCSKQAFASIRVLDDGSVVFSRTNELAQIKEATSSPGAVQAGGRHFVVAVFERVSGQGQKLYIDGSLVAQNTDITTQNNPLFRRFEAGRDTDTSGENFDGRIQHVFLINQVALSQAQIGTLVAAANSGASGGPSINVDRGFAPPPDEATGDETASITGSTLEVEILERETISATVLTLEEYMSVLDIWNVALTRLGIEPVTSAPTSDGSPQGVILATNWPLFKEAFLRDASWDGAKKTAALTTFKDSDGVTPVVPTARWNFAYERPSDHVRSLRLNGRENRPGDKDVAGSLGLWEEEVATNDVGTRKRCLFTDEASANLEYVFLVPDSDITLMPADMRWAMALALAAHVATSFGKTTTEASMLELDAEKAKRNALRTDSATGTKPTLIDYTIANAFW